MHFDIQTGKTNEILRTKSEKVTSAEMRKYIRLGEDMV